jgi:hypothetical protein
MRFQSLGVALAQGEPADADIKIKSMQLANDPRYKEFKYHKEAAHSENSHFTRIAGEEKTVKEDTTECPTDISFARVVEMEKQALRGGDSQSRNQRLFAVQDRVVWEQEFVRSVDRLLVDFELTQDPYIRLRHLDEMHGWFTDQGAKQERKVKPTPSYLTLDNTPPIASMMAIQELNIGHALIADALFIGGLESAVAAYKSCIAKARQQ